MTENEASWFDLAFGYRKTIIMTALILLGTIFRIKGYMDGGQFVDLLKNTTLAFFGSNGLEHICTTVKQYVNAKGQKESVVSTDVGAQQ